MEDLFSAIISIRDQNINYSVAFDQDKYVFIPETRQKDFPSFSFKRENDQWLEESSVPAEIKKQALNALELYLLKQH